MSVRNKHYICHKVFPKLLEEEFLKNDSVKAISIVGKARVGESLVNDLVAFVVLEDGVAEQSVLEELEEIAMSRLQSYERPCQYVFLESLPRTIIGKIDYHALEAREKKLEIKSNNANL